MKTESMNEIKITNSEENMTPIVVETLRVCGDNTVLSFAEGEYHFYLDGCLTAYFCPVCNQSGNKDIIFPLFYKKNIVIDGNGSRFVFHDRVFPFIIKKCENITFKNFSVTFSFMRYCLFEAKRAEKGIALFIDSEKYDYRVSESGELIFKCGSTEFSNGEKLFFVKQNENRYCYLKTGKWLEKPKNLPAAILSCSAEKTENGVFLRYESDNEFTDLQDGNVVINYDEDRANGIFFFENCKNTKVQNVTVYRGAGMGIISQLCENIEMDGVRFLPGEKGDEVYSTTADALFFTNCTGCVLLHNCKVTHTMDDAVSVHNIYAKVEKILSPKKVLLRYRHIAHGGYDQFSKGDKVVVTDGKSGNEKAECEVQCSFIGNDTYCTVLTFSENITDKIFVGDFIENHYRSPRVVIENNVFDYVPHIRLGSAQKVIVRNNYIMNSICISLNDMLDGWFAYGKSDDVEITGNRFSHCECAVRAFVDRPAGNRTYHGNVLIQKNLVTECEKGFELGKITNLQFKNNGYQGVKEENKTTFTDILNLDTEGVGQLLMRRDTVPFTPTPLPEGYRKFTFHRGGNSEMSMEEYIKAWFRVEPYWNMDEFNFFYGDERIPEDGHFLILDEKGEVAAHSNVQIDQHKPNSQTVHFVSVGEQYRGKKLGYCVSETVLDYALKHNAPMLYLTTDEFRIPALKIYLKLGFKPVIEYPALEHRWFPIMRMYGYQEYYDKDENLCILE